MFGFTKRVKPPVFALGKLPGHPEFLASPDADAGVIDRWLDAGWQGAHADAGETWNSAFAAGDTYGFLWSHGPKATDATCGVIAPSVDSIGRHYPLVVASRMGSAGLGGRWPLLPNAGARFLDAAQELMVECHAAGLAPGELSTRLIHLAPPSIEELEEASRAQAAWNAETSVLVGWAPIFPEDTALGAKRALARLVAGVRPALDREWPSTPLVVRLPLGEGGPASTVVWLEALRAILGWSETVPSAFWAAEGGCVLVSLGAVAPPLLRHLWSAGSAAFLVDVASGGESEGELATAVEALDALEGVDGTGSMADCLAILAGVGRSG